MIFVTVASPIGREVYLNGEYDAAVGTVPFTVPLNPGSHVLETLVESGGFLAVDFEGWVFNLPNLASMIVNLVAVEPPRPVGPLPGIVPPEPPTDAVGV